MGACRAFHHACHGWPQLEGQVAKNQGPLASMSEGLTQYLADAVIRGDLEMVLEALVGFCQVHIPKSFGVELILAGKCFWDQLTQQPNQRL